ncbi:MAG: hypothetical protein E3J78_00415 [Candidatus Cloacimonadota bacterium]|jgi:hypothetical protein|nr:MAG: hypothetical protein E3J78_00415 [Candidatus Cloacimonadota bacterium]
MKVTVDLKNIDLRERVKQIANRKLSGNFIIISGKHYASFSYRNGEFQRARFDDIKGDKAMENILELKEGLLTINIIEKENEKEKLWRIIENLPNLLFCGIIEGGIFTNIILKKETRFSEKEINTFLKFLMLFSDRQKTKLREITLVYDYYLLYIERVKEGIYTVFLLPKVSDIRLLTISIRNITVRVGELLFSGKYLGY